MKTETIIKGLQTALNENAVADEFKFLIKKAMERLIEYSANEEVKRGKWIVKKGQSYLVHPMKYDENGEPMLQDYISYECPFCGLLFSRKEPYCNCGAKMDGGNAE